LRNVRPLNDAVNSFVRDDYWPAHSIELVKLIALFRLY